MRSVRVCPFNVHLILLYTRYRVLSSYILTILIGATICHKIILDRMLKQVYNIPIGMTGGFIYIT